jgi:predicted porin
MNKKLLAIAIGAAVSAAPMFASADVTLYGHAQVEVASVDNSSTGNLTNVADNARGRLGVKASEKLGNGMTAIAGFEWKIDTTQGGQATGQRESFVGLKGDFGTISAGHLKSAYKYTGGIKYDPFVATLIEARGANGMSKDELGNASFGHNGFLANSIGYMSPKIGGGFTAWGTYSPDEVSSSNGGDGDYSFGLKFKQKDFEVFVAGVNNDDTTGGDAIKFGGQYKFGNFKISGQYEMLSGNSANASLGANNDADIYFIGGQAKFGNNVLVAQFGDKDVDGAAGSLSYYTIGLIHNLSKTTRLTAGYRSYESSATVDVDTFAVGMRVIF